MDVIEIGKGMKEIDTISPELFSLSRAISTGIKIMADDRKYIGHLRFVDDNCNIRNREI